MKNMKKYIYAESLVRDLIDNRSFFPVIVKCAIEDAPAADVVEVVRCKDCKHATFYSCKNDVCYQAIICEYQIGIGDENFFCSCGERKDEGK